MKSIKRRLTEHEEFKLMQMVFDKFLWLGTGLVAFGLYSLVLRNVISAVLLIAIGLIFMLLFGWIVVKEFEQLR